jgi:sec-independent protein translocase protein TatA
MFGKLGLGELLVILLIVLIIFGAGKLPEIGRGLGKGIKNFRKAASGLEEDESEESAKGKVIEGKKKGEES